MEVGKGWSDTLSSPPFQRRTQDPEMRRHIRPAERRSLAQVVLHGVLIQTFKLNVWHRSRASTNSATHLACPGKIAAT